MVADFAQGYSTYSELKNFPWGLKEMVSSEKYILQPCAHNSILPMSVDTLPLKPSRAGLTLLLVGFLGDVNW